MGVPPLMETPIKPEWVGSSTKWHGRKSRQPPRSLTALIGVWQVWYVPPFMSKNSHHFELGQLDHSLKPHLSADWSGVGKPSVQGSCALASKHLRTIIAAVSWVGIIRAAWHQGIWGFHKWRYPNGWMVYKGKSH